MKTIEKQPVLLLPLDQLSNSTRPMLKQTIKANHISQCALILVSSKQFKADRIEIR